MNIIIRIYTCQKRKVKVWKDPIKEDKGDERDYGEEEGMRNRPAPYRATSPPVTVPATEAEFPLWIARLNLCFKNMRERGSPEREAKREPISLQRAAADSPQVPRVSTAIGANWKFPD